MPLSFCGKKRMERLLYSRNVPLPKDLSKKVFVHTALGLNFNNKWYSDG